VNQHNNLLHYDLDSQSFWYVSTLWSQCLMRIDQQMDEDQDLFK